MNLTINGYHIVWIILTTFIVSAILTPITKKIAFHIHAVNEPNYRRLNKVTMPVLGGMAIFASFLIGYMIFGRASTEMIAILIGAFLMFMMGLIDDIKPIPAKYKFLIEIIACCIVIFYGEIFIDHLSILGLSLTFSSPISYIVTLGIMLVIINIINLCDGLDGLCSGTSVIYFTTITIIAFLMGTAGGLDITIALLMVGSLLGFLVHNFPPAKQYLGDNGSNFIGFMIAITALLGFKTATFTSIIIPLVILATPFIDVIFSVIRRVLRGQNPFTTPDKNHIHHQFLNMEFSTRSSVIIIYIINISFAAVSVLYAIGFTDYAFILYFALMIIFLFIALKTEVIFKRNTDPIEEQLMMNLKEDTSEKKEKTPSNKTKKASTKKNKKGKRSK